MALLPDRFIEQVAQATDIVAVVGQFVALTKRGKEYMGVCPFHDDHRPSMYVSPAKQIYKCFACGAGGGVFHFLQNFQKLTFPEAVRRLAEEAGIAVPAETTRQQGDRSLSSESLVKLMTFAARFYREQLFAEGGSAALAYAHGRKLSEESVRRFGLGYAPDSWDALRSAALSASFTDRQLAAAGLTSAREDGSGYDRFRNRLIFPILDATGRVIAFGGRALSPDERAKYLNSPETALFDKSANLYALNWSRQAIIESGQAVVVEGYLDALMCLQEGVGNVVATLGTALTERHVRMLGRLSREVVLVFDADTAGQAAATRAMELFLMQRVNVRIAGIPQSDDVKDPCDFILAEGADAFGGLLADAPDALEHAWSRRLAEYEQADTLAARRAIIEDFLTLIVSSAAYGAIDPVRQALLAGQAAELVGVSQAQITEQMSRLARRVRRGGAAGAKGEPAESDKSAGTDRAESWLLGALIDAPELFESVRESIGPDMFADPLLKVVAEKVWSLAAEGKLELSVLLAAGQSAEWGRLVTDLHLSGQQRGNHERTIADTSAALIRRQDEQELQALKEKGDMDQTELFRRIQSQARRPDGRRRPRLP